MKIMYLTTQFHSHGGIEKILRLKINYLIENFDYSVTLCTASHGSRDHVYKLNGAASHYDLNIAYNQNKSYLSFENIYKTIRHYYLLRKLVKNLGPDIIVSVNSSPEQYFLPFMGRGIPKVKEFHSSGFSFSRKSAIIRLLKSGFNNLYRLYDCIILLNESEKKYLPYSNVRVIPNFVDMTPNQNYGIRDNIILAAGRIAAIKQFNHLILAWSQLHLKFPEWRVKIYGEGDEELTNTLKERIEDLKISNISFEGATDNLGQEMRNSKVFAMTSATECFPMVLLEAQACAMSIVSYNCPHGPKHIIDNGISALLVKHNDINAFANKLEFLLLNENKIKEYSLNGVKSVKRYDAKIVMKIWDSLFHELVNFSNV